MSVPSPSGTRFAWVAALAGDAFRHLRHGGEPMLWSLAIALAATLTWLVTWQVWTVVAAETAGGMLAVLRWTAMAARLRKQLTAREQDYGVIEQALRRSQRLETLGRLAVDVAHDFNNQLTVISNNIELAAGRLTSGQAHLSRHADAALQGVRRATLLANRLLSLSRQSSSEPDMVEVDRVVAGLSELLRRTLGNRVKLTVTLSGTPWYAWADVTAMENALLSLVVNARDHVPDGAALTITVSNVDAEAGDTLPVPGDYIQVAVTAAAGSSHWQPANDHSSADLFMVQGFAREVGGCLLCSAAPSGGLALRLFIPRYQPPAVRASHPPGHDRTTILVVEDEEPLRAAYVTMLRAQGYDVLEAPDAMEAVRLIADHGPIDLLFTDIGLPGGVSGRALADAARHVDPTMRVLFTTGYEQTDIAEWPTLLRKPFDPAQLAAKVREILATTAAVAPALTVRA